jgi:hypothetical protein
VFLRNFFLLTFSVIHEDGLRWDSMAQLILWCLLAAETGYFFVALSGGPLALYAWISFPGEETVAWSVVLTFCSNCCHCDFPACGH